MLVSILALLMGKDDLRLCLYAPFYIFGYKQFLDFVMVKALIDIILGGGQYLKRERVERYGFEEVEKSARTTAPQVLQPVRK
jgi:hypothetical protein